MKLDLDVTLTGRSLEIETRFARISHEMNNNPIHISQENYEYQLAKAQNTFNLLEREVRQAVGIAKFRPNASADCVEYFLSKGLRLSRKTPSGKPAMDKEVLLEIARQHPVAGMIVECREALAKLGQLRKWAENAERVDVQPQWNQFGTPMGRLSCEAPALQNRVMEVRETVVPHDGYVFLSCDVSQMEYRMWASLSQDATLICAFNTDGKDFHQVMGEKVAKYLPAGADVRKYGKTINFALLYRMQASTLAAQLGVSTLAGENIRNEYMREASTAEAYAQRILSDARKSGKISTIFGRERMLPDLKSGDEKLRNDAMKTAWHHHNAGTAAEYFKWVMCRVDDALIQADLKQHVKWVINMHDEFILEVRVGYEDQVAKLVAASVTVPYADWVPMVHSIVIGTTWAGLDS